MQSEYIVLILRWKIQFDSKKKQIYQAINIGFSFSIFGFPFSGAVISDFPKKFLNF